MARELRFAKVAPEVRSGDDGAPVLAGYGAVFNRLSQNLGGFVEEVDPAAFDETLNRIGERNVLGAVNHDPSWLLATTDSETLRLSTDNVGLAYAMALDPEDPDAVRAMAKVKTGKMRGSSFSFRTLDDSWSTTEQGFPLRRLLQVELYELGPVASPAYRDTEKGDAAVALRSLSKFVDLPFEQVAAAATAGHLTDLILRDIPQDDPEPEAPGDTAANGSARRGRRNPPTR